MTKFKRVDAHHVAYRLVRRLVDGGVDKFDVYLELLDRDKNTTDHDVDLTMSEVDAILDKLNDYMDGIDYDHYRN